MYGSSVVPSNVDDPHGVDPRPRERHAELKATKQRGRHARHKSHRPFSWLHPRHEQAHD